MNNSHDSTNDWAVIIGLLILFCCGLIIVYKVFRGLWKFYKSKKSERMKEADVLDISNIISLKRKLH